MDQRIQRKVNLGKTPLDLADDLVLYIVDFLGASDRIKIELCLNRGLNSKWHYKQMFEKEHFYETYVSGLKIGDIIIDLRSSNYSKVGLTTTVTYKHHRKHIIHDRNISTRAGTRQVIGSIMDGRLKLFRGPEIVHYRWLRKRRRNRR